ncbi:hypothetical protein GN958_ATG13504 [Phytophthora infestans]|uniref:Uncharacterized protein n=1 Tax=Phytophthora infestans TaxID=4787 RepID=A0A8S9UEA8_PHYIN|nr:hypothetical protein GN958_ATG13504 [Phytophthora infestans]
MNTNHVTASESQVLEDAAWSQQLSKHCTALHCTALHRTVQCTVHVYCTWFNSLNSKLEPSHRNPEALRKTMMNERHDLALHRRDD